MNTQSSTQNEEKSQQEPQLGLNATTNTVFSQPTSDPRSELRQLRIPIEGTILSKGWLEGKGWAIGLDGKRLTDWVESEEEIDEKIKKGGLTLQEITRMIYVLIEDHNEQEEFKKQQLKDQENDN